MSALLNCEMLCNAIQLFLYYGAYSFLQKRSFFYAILWPNSGFADEGLSGR